ncbi:MAG: hypothetical protein SAK29_38910, partial [Scytonema sp. PMC 1069.18]|nr:hypothetical protein [Scytonema sp. PMC 1069.18]
ILPSSWLYLGEVLLLYTWLSGTEQFIWVALLLFTPEGFFVRLIAIAVTTKSICVTFCHCPCHLFVRLMSFHRLAIAVQYLKSKTKLPQALAKFLCRRLAPITYL